jgi:hypothetical protein
MGGIIALSKEPVTIADLAFHFHKSENEMRAAYEVLEGEGFVTITDEDHVIINFDKYQNLSKSARDEKFKLVENRIDQSFSGENPTPTYQGRVSRLPFLEVNEILKRGNYSELSVYVDTMGDYLNDVIISKFQELEEKGYSYKFLRAVIVEADANLTDNETAYKMLWEQLRGDKNENVPPKPPETTETKQETTNFQKPQDSNTETEDLLDVFLSQPFKRFSGFFESNSMWLESLLVSPDVSVAINDLKRNSNFTGKVGEFIEGVGWSVDTSSTTIRRWLEIEGLLSKSENQHDYSVIPNDYLPEEEESEAEEFPF